MQQITRIAHRAARAYERRDSDAVDSLYEKAIDIAGEEDAKLALMQACIIRAAKARRNHQHGDVCRLKEAAYAYKPVALTRAEVRALLVKAGAAGYLPRQPSHYPKRSMLALVMGEG